MSVRVCTLANGAVGTVAAAPKRAVVVEWCGAVAAAAGEVVAAGAETGTVTAGVVAAVAPAGGLGGGAAARPGTLPPSFLV